MLNTRKKCFIAIIYTGQLVCVKIFWFVYTTAEALLHWCCCLCLITPNSKMCCLIPLWPPKHKCTTHPKHFLVILISQHFHNFQQLLYSTIFVVLYKNIKLIHSTFTHTQFVTFLSRLWEAVESFNNFFLNTGNYYI